MHKGQSELVLSNAFSVPRGIIYQAHNVLLCSVFVLGNGV